MIDATFKDNWLKILNFNSKLEIFEDSKPLKEIVRIPLTPIQADAHILYSLFEILYPKFINDQQNILDIVISEDEKDILKIILYQTRKPGIHESYQVLPNKMIKYKSDDLENIEKLYDKVQSVLVKKENIRISSLRIIKKKAIDLINEYCTNIDKASVHSFLKQFSDLIQTLFRENLIFVYPEPNLFKLFVSLVNYLKGVRFGTFIEFILDLLPDFNYSFILNSDRSIVVMLFKKFIISSRKSDFTIKLYSATDLGINTKEMSINRILNKVKIQLKSNNVYIVDQNLLISILLDIFELEIPFDLNNVLLIFQKMLFGLRSYEDYWYVKPQPKVYNSLRRFLVRLFGINLNLKKISHWAIPEMTFNVIQSYLGLNSKILIIITDIGKFKKTKSINSSLLTNGFKYALLLELENGTVKNIAPIDKIEIFPDNKFSGYEDLRVRFLDKVGYISAIVNIDKLVLKEIIGSFGSQLSKVRPFTKFKALKLLKNRIYFNIYPELPLFRVIRDISVKQLVKTFMPIFIDKHEF